MTIHSPPHPTYLKNRAEALRPVITSSPATAASLDSKATSRWPNRADCYFFQLSQRYSRQQYGREDLWQHAVSGMSSNNPGGEQMNSEWKTSLRPVSLVPLSQSLLRVIA